MVSGYKEVKMLLEKLGDGFNPFGFYGACNCGLCIKIKEIIIGNPIICAICNGEVKRQGTFVVDSGTIPKGDCVAIKGLEGPEDYI